MDKEIFYHGSGVLFPEFDLAHALEGDGKVKFGYGVYVTSAYTSAAHYSASNENWTDHYVYTVEIPSKTNTNYIAFKQSVHPDIIARAVEKLKLTISEKATCDGKEFRKFLVKHFMSQDKSLTTLEGERLASQFLTEIGVDFIEWPYNWKNPAQGSNRAILDDSKIRIVRIDSVKLDDKKKLIPGSEKEVTL